MPKFEIAFISSIIFSILVVIIMSTYIWYLVRAQSRRQIIEERKKEAKLERKQILANAYKEINDAKAVFSREMELERNEIQRMKDELDFKANELQKSKEINDAKSKRIDAYLLDIEKRRNQLDEKENKIIVSLEEISGYTKQQAKKMLIDMINTKSKKELISILKNSETEAHKRAKELSNKILISAMERIKVDIANQKTSNLVKLPSDDMKGRIIGKDGRNMKTFEQVGGVDIIIDESPNIVTVSSFNPIRREIATRALEQLIIDGRIQPVKIEQELKKQEKEVEQIIQEAGMTTINQLKITNIDFELVKLIGKLKFRTSYGQNVLTHSIEVAQLSGAIAAELGLDIDKAIRAGLLHDIGKAVDFEEEGSHVVLGAKIARDYGEDDIVINAIESHHEETEKESEIAAIVAIADSISASRPGARNNSIGEFVLRMHEIEKIGNEIPGVAKTYALQSGRQIRLIVDPIAVSDLELSTVLEKMKEKIQKQIQIPGEITITVIREKREINTI